MISIDAAATDGETSGLCQSVGIPRASFYRRRQPAPPSTPRSPRVSPWRALVPAERQAVLEVLHSKLAIHRSVAPRSACHALRGAVKASAADAIAELRKKGIKIVMLTGDTRTTAIAVAQSISIDRVEADVLPDQKAAVIKKLQGEGEIVAMAGDGVNDAPALAQAHVGIAMGTGTDVAMESAGVTLVKGDLRGIVRAQQLSAATMKNIRQNLFFAFVYNALGVPLAAGVLYPWFGILLSPMIASAAMTLSSVSVIANALRLRRVSF